MNHQKTYFKHLSTKIFALLVFGFSLINTSGYSIATVDVSSYLVEATIGQQRPIDAPGISAFSAYSSSADNTSKCDPSPLQSKNVFLANFSNRQSVKYQSISKKQNTFNPKAHLIRSKRIPQHSDDPFSVSCS